MKRKRNTAQMKEQTRKTEVQINEEEMGKIPEKKMQESINKDLEELRINIQRQATQLLKSKIL